MEQTIVCRISEPLPPDQLLHVQKQGLQLEHVYITKPGFFLKLGKGLAFLASPYPLFSAGYYFQRLRHTLHHLLTTGEYDLIVMDGSQLAVYWPLISKSRILKVLQLHNIEEEVLWRRARLLPLGPRKLLNFHDAIKMRPWENRMIQEADLVFVTSEREREKLNKRHPGVMIRVASNGVDCDEITPLKPSGIREVLFVGSLRYFPNVDGVLHFAREVLPRIRNTFPDLTFRVVGKTPDSQICALDNLDGIKITGEVGDLTPYYQDCSVCVVPLRTGGGTRLKILEAMAYGRPVVSTSLGCEGLRVEHNKHLLIADEPNAMAQAIEMLLCDQNLANQLATNARSLVEKTYSWAKISREIYYHYKALVDKRGCAPNAPSM